MQSGISGDWGRLMTRPSVNQEVPAAHARRIAFFRGGVDWNRLENLQARLLFERVYDEGFSRSYRALLLFLRVVFIRDWISNAIFLAIFFKALVFFPRIFISFWQNEGRDYAILRIRKWKKGCSLLKVSVMTRRKLATRVQLMDTQGSLPLRLGPHFYAANFRAVLSTTTCSRARQTAQEDKSHWFSNRVDNYIKTSIETSEDSNIPDLNEIRNKLLSKSWNKSCIELGSSKTVLLKLIFVKIHSYRSRQKLWMEPPVTCLFLLETRFSRLSLIPGLGLVADEARDPYKEEEGWK